MVTPSQIGWGLAAVLALYFGYTPLWLYRTIVAILFTGFGAVIPAGPQDDGSLKEAMRNVTRDYEQVRRCISVLSICVLLIELLSSVCCLFLQTTQSL